MATKAESREAIDRLHEGCPSNDHSNGDRDYTPHMNGVPNTFTPGYVGHWHKDGGYALRQRWL